MPTFSAVFVARHYIYTLYGIYCPRAAMDARANKRTSIADAHISTRVSPSSMRLPSWPLSMFTADIFTADAHRHHPEIAAACGSRAAWRLAGRRMAAHMRCTALPEPHEVALAAHQ